ncbi:MAG: M50 family metallopeptidase [Planctomycetales bacterium]|nr:M50 family metallopeptidase [Planctomycetales bacterium]
MIGSLLPLCWLGMMAVHEAGHAIGARYTGGEVTKIVVHPLTISRTDVSPNPHPLIVVWAGPILGCVLPLLAWIIWRTARIPASYLPRFFAGFCFVANGTYIGVGVFSRAGDAGEMLRYGSPIWSSCLFGAMASVVGLVLWHNLGGHFGFRDSDGRVHLVFRTFAFHHLRVVSGVQAPCDADT